MRCNCPGFRARSSCKHTRFVKARMVANNGTYPLVVSNKADERAAKVAQRSQRNFREFVLKYGKIEVL